MNSVMLKANGDLLTVPNTKLRTSAVTNLSRSAPRADNFSFVVDLPNDPADMQARVLAAVKVGDTPWSGA
jgi:small-conductance mechanosensitive channel